MSSDTNTNVDVEHPIPVAPPVKPEVAVSNGSHVPNLELDCKADGELKQSDELSRPMTPDQQGVMSSSSSVSSSSSPATPRDTSLNTSGLLDTLNESATRDDLSSGSPSPTPDGNEVEVKPKPKIQLGKDISLMMQALESLQSPEEKIAALCKKYADLLQQQKVLQKQLRTSQKKQTLILKEKDKAQVDHSKVMLANSKLESLARELQKRNKSMKEEQTRKHNEEVVLRKEMASKFQSSLSHIESKMKLAIDGNTKLSSENESMHKRLNEMVQKYQQRENTLEQLVHQYNLEAQLSSAQYEKSMLECATEKEKHEHEIKKLLERILERDNMLEIKTQQENELQQQIRYYSEKFEDFQATLERSNEVFASFQEQIDKLSKQLKKAEKEKMVFQKKWEDATRGISETISYAQKIEGKQTRLEKLSRALQAERNELAQRLRQYEGDGKENKKGVKGPRKKSATINTKGSLNGKNSRSSTPDLNEKRALTPPVAKSPTPAKIIDTGVSGGVITPNPSEPPPAKEEVVEVPVEAEAKDATLQAEEVVPAKESAEAESLQMVNGSDDVPAEEVPQPDTNAVEEGSQADTKTDEAVGGVDVNDFVIRHNSEPEAVVEPAGNEEAELVQSESPLEDGVLRSSNENVPSAESQNTDLSSLNELD